MGEPADKPRTDFIDASLNKSGITNQCFRHPIDGAAAVDVFVECVVLPKELNKSDVAKILAQILAKETECTGVKFDCCKSR